MGINFCGRRHEVFCCWLPVLNSSFFVYRPGTFRHGSLDDCNNRLYKANSFFALVIIGRSRLTSPLEEPDRAFFSKKKSFIFNISRVKSEYTLNCLDRLKK
jgi:hypothetical protein